MRVVSLVAVAQLGLVFPPTASALDVFYGTPTSSPEGRATCLVSGSVKQATGSDVGVSLAPTSGEGALQLDITPKSAPDAGAGIAVFAGTQPGCDIFPAGPTGATAPLLVPARVYGILDLHAHPGTDCLASGNAQGKITFDAVGLEKAKLKVRCDRDQAHANLHLRHHVPLTAFTGETVTSDLVVENHGPGDATGVTVGIKVPRGFFPVRVMPSQGTCHYAFKKHRWDCALGTIPVGFIPVETATVSFDVIPLEVGTEKTQITTTADNAGDILATDAKTKTDVAKGSSAILSVEVRCKGAAGTVTINPNGSGGVTTCTCPDPADATRDVVQCVEVYDQKTTVTLTPSATTGAFDKWKGACAGNPAACMLTLDPSAAHPDQSASAKFK